FLPLVRELRIGKRLIVIHDVIDIENYIQAADAGLYASDKESFGMGVLETMSYGKPVVATRVGGIPEIVEHGKTGFLHKKEDTASLSASVLRLASDPALAAQMGALARRRAASYFSPAQSVTRYVDFYRRICRAG